MGVLNNRKFRWIMRCGWLGRCPRCGEGRIFAGWLSLAARCDKCGLDLGFARTDDGPAFFALCITALPLTFVVVWVQVVFDPPWWVHVLTSLPILAFGCLFSLRPFKGWLVASQYANHVVASDSRNAWDLPESPNPDTPGQDNR